MDHAPVNGPMSVKTQEAKRGLSGSYGPEVGVGWGMKVEDLGGGGGVDMIKTHCMHYESLKGLVKIYF